VLCGDEDLFWNNPEGLDVQEMTPTFFLEDRLNSGSMTFVGKKMT